MVATISVKVTDTRIDTMISYVCDILSSDDDLSSRSLVREILFESRRLFDSYYYCDDKIVSSPDSERGRRISPEEEFEKSISCACILVCADKRAIS